MSTRSICLGLALGLLALLPASCFSSSGSAASTAGGAGTFLGPVFAGVGNASPLSPTEVVVQWPPAGSSSVPASLIKYRIYRAFDPNSVLLETAFIAETAPGATTYADTDDGAGLPGLPSFTTIFYRVVAVDPAGRESLSSRIASVFTPAPYMGGLVDYSTDVEPLWTTPPSGGSPQTCLSCHSAAGSATMKLDSWEGVQAGLGTINNPDSFLVPFPYDGVNTWLEFLSRFSATPLPHLNYLSNPGSIAGFQGILETWVDEGALEEPDDQPPYFEFDDINNAGQYYAFFPTFDEVTVHWFHASDPESLPLSGANDGQIEYEIFAGEDPETIDWEHPVAYRIYSPVVEHTFPWPGTRIAIAVRALDASGRHDPWPADNDPDFKALSMPRRHNESINSRVIVISREAP